ncbi:hypothetical protein PV396_11635 [Streptomyces sp. ME02-8801-2C]|uniref:hypothetical protein n=1 Tax=Streptomyces sp. ME02-8801-2C TaxID=3028680 RepID=UPI0029B42BD7|nr:hypothetical protein [Streptomyces sp. ME02-8801-2C]MDX3452589.1 hypothetical protein [Streptomyces sp. ME02-8801-2C]
MVFERNRPDDTFGFGVVFSDATRDAIDAGGPVLSEALEKHGRHWDEIEVRVHGARERVGGMGMGRSGTRDAGERQVHLVRHQLPVRRAHLRPPGRPARCVRRPRLSDQ